MPNKTSTRRKAAGATSGSDNNTNNNNHSQARRRTGGREGRSRLVRCPFPGDLCDWQGSMEHVLKHLGHSHKSMTTLEGDDIVFLAYDVNLPGAIDWVMMQACYGQKFMLVLEKIEKHEGHPQFFAAAQLIGPRVEADKFICRLQLKKDRRRFTWEATPLCVTDGISAAIQASNCLVFDPSIAQLFTEKGNLAIHVTILEHKPKPAMEATTSAIAVQQRQMT